MNMLQFLLIKWKVNIRHAQVLLYFRSEKKLLLWSVIRYKHLREKWSITDMTIIMIIIVILCAEIGSLEHVRQTKFKI